MENRKRPTFVPKTWDLPEAIRSRLGTDPGRQRMMDEDGHLLLILHEAPTPEDEENRRAFVLWGSPDGTWKSAPTAGGLGGLDAHLDSYRSAIQSLDDDTDTADSPQDYFDVVKRSLPLLRSTKNLLNVLQAARTARPADQRLIVARDSAINLERAIDLTAGEAKAGMDYTLAMHAEAQATAAQAATDEARRLNRLVAFFFPMATIAAVLGINEVDNVIADPGFRMTLIGGLIAGLMTWAIIARPTGKR